MRARAEGCLSGLSVLGSLGVSGLGGLHRGGKDGPVGEGLGQLLAVTAHKLPQGPVLLLGQFGVALPVQSHTHRQVGSPGRLGQGIDIL